MEKKVRRASADVRRFEPNCARKIVKKRSGNLCADAWISIGNGLHCSASDERGIIGYTGSQ